MLFGSCQYIMHCTDNEDNSVTYKLDIFGKGVPILNYMTILWMSDGCMLCTKWKEMVSLVN